MSAHCADCVHRVGHTCTHPDNRIATGTIDGYLEHPTIDWSGWCPRFEQKVWPKLVPPPDPEPHGFPREARAAQTVVAAMNERCICALGQEPVATRDYETNTITLTWPNGRGNTIPVAAEILEEMVATQNRLQTELTELRRRHKVLLDNLDADRGTTIPKRHVRAILKGR